MRWLRGLLVRARWIVLRRAVEREMDEEIRFHLDMEAEKNVRTGMPSAEARRAARLAFGGIERHRETLREGRRAHLFESLAGDLRFSLRALQRSPGLTLVSVVTVAVGIGATATVVSLANALLFRPLPLHDPVTLVTLQERRRVNTAVGVEGTLIPYSRYRAYEERTRDVFTHLAAHRLGRFSIRLDDVTISVDGVRVSQSYFDALTVTPALGRFFDSDDAAEVVLSSRIWRERFGGGSDVLGRTLYVDSRPYTVAGVVPDAFRGTTVGLAADVWMPLLARGEMSGAKWAEDWVTPFGRLRPGWTLASADTRVHNVALAILPEDGARVDGAYLEPLAGLAGPARGAIGGLLAILLGLAVLVLLIASANVAGALLAKSLARRREIAIRLAIGAGRGALIRQLLVEGLLLFLMGGVGGLVFAYLTTNWLARLPLPLPTELILDLSPDERVLAFALGLAGVTGVLFGLLPALRASKPDLLPALKQSDGGDPSAVRIRSVFVSAQVAMSVLLLVLAVLFARSFQRAVTLDPGFDADGVVVATIDLAPHGFDDSSGRAFYSRLIERVSALPGVHEAALAQFVLLAIDGFGSDVTVPDADSAAPTRSDARWNAVDPAYLSTLGIELIAGRRFSEADDQGGERVAIVNETLANRLWPEQNALGRRIRRGDRTDMVIVGVVRDSKYMFLAEGSTPYVFVPFAQEYHARMSLHVRAPSAEAATLQAITSAVREVDPNIALERAEPMSRTIEFALFPHRFAAQVVGALGLTGLILAAVGLYGVLAYQVTQRMREFGIRKVLGARNVDVWTIVLRKTGLLTSIGCGIGVAFGAAAATLMRAALLGLNPLDPATLAVVSATLAAVALLASAVPAIRATSVNAVDAIRAD